MPTLSGTLLTPNGAPLANAAITLISQRNEGENILRGVSSEFSTDASGEYSQSVEPGLYSVKLNYQQQFRDIGVVFIDVDTDSSIEVLLAAGDDAEFVSIVALQNFLSDAQAAQLSAEQSADDAVSALAENQAQLDALVSEAQADVDAAIGAAFVAAEGANSAASNAASVVEGFQGSWYRLNNYVASYFNKSDLNGRGPTLSLVDGSAPAGRTYIDRFGIQRTLAANQLGESETGWVVNSESENLLSYSSDLVTGWNRNQVVIAQSEELGLDSITPMSAVIPNVADSAHFISSFFQAVAGQRYAFSVAIKSGDFDQIRLTVGGAVFSGGLGPNVLFRFSTGEVSQFNQVDSARFYGPYVNDIYILSMSFTPDTTAPVNVFIYGVDGGANNFVGNNSDRFFVDQAQLEPVPFFTGFIPTNGTPVARPATRFKRVNLIDLSQPFSIYCKYNYIGEALDFENLISTDNNRFVVGTNHLQLNRLVVQYNGQFFPPVPNAYGDYEMLLVFDGVNLSVYANDGNLLWSVAVNNVLSRGIESLRFFSGSSSRLTADCEAGGVTVWDFALSANEAKLLLGGING